MIVFDGLGGLVMLALWIFCFIDVITTPEKACRNLPKLVWVFVVLLVPLVGPIGWLVAGRPWTTQTGAPMRRTAGTGRPAGYDRSNRYVPGNPDDDDEFLAGLRKRTEEQRRRARDQDTNDSLEGDQA